MLTSVFRDKKVLDTLALYNGTNLTVKYLPGSFRLDICEKKFGADFTLNFYFNNDSGDVQQNAAEMYGKLKYLPQLKKVEQLEGYINITLKRDCFFNDFTKVTLHKKHPKIRIGELPGFTRQALEKIKDFPVPDSIPIFNPKYLLKPIERRIVLSGSLFNKQHDARSLQALCQDFAAWYRSCPMLHDQNTNICHARMNLLAAIQRVVKNV